MQKLVIGCALASLTACAAQPLSGLAPNQPATVRIIEASSPIGLDVPVGLAEDKSGNLYVANAGSSQILVYNSKNQQLTSKTIGDGVDQPAGLAFDKAGDLYASQRSSQEVTVYSSAGKLLKTFDTDKNSGYAPSGVAVDSSGNTWVANRDNTNYDVGEIEVFDSSGKVVHSSSETLAYPIGVLLEGADAWVFNSETAAITVFDAGLKLIETIGLSGLAPAYAAKSSDGEVYVTDEEGSSIAVLSSSGKILKITKNKGLDNPAGIAFAKSGNFYVANSGNDTITEYNSKGSLIHTIR
jgi:DNA-binding beta-propeller fold protein YncE